MKRLVLLSSLLILPIFLHAQTTKLVGAGSAGGGSIFAINENGTNPEKWADFTVAQSPSDLLYSNGKLWGVTKSGGTNASGIIFSLDTDGTNFTKAHDFDGTNGGTPSR